MNYKKLVISLALPQLAGLIGSFFTSPVVSSIWYKSLEKPFFNPPAWLFGPVWITLYIIMGISVYLVWQKVEQNPPSPKAPDGQGKTAGSALWLFWIHLFFNAVWSIIFFGLKNPGLAFLDIIIIWLLIIVLIMKFWKINKWSAYLLIPYLAWVSFAGALNYFIWRLN